RNADVGATGPTAAVCCSHEMALSRWCRAHFARPGRAEGRRQEAHHASWRLTERLWCERDDAGFHGLCWAHVAGTTTIAAYSAAVSWRRANDRRCHLP